MNIITISGRLPKFEANKYIAAEYDGNNKITKQAFISWGINVTIGSKKNEKTGYYDEALVNFTANGWSAEALKTISDSIKESTKPIYVVITGKFVPAKANADGVAEYLWYKNDGTVGGPTFSINASDVVIYDRIDVKSNQDNTAFDEVNNTQGKTNSTPSSPPINKRPGTPPPKNTPSVGNGRTRSRI